MMSSCFAGSFGFNPDLSLNATGILTVADNFGLYQWQPAGVDSNGIQCRQRHWMRMRTVIEDDEVRIIPLTGMETNLLQW